MVAPAPIALIAEKLESQTEGVRLVALAHAAAHGPAARVLAAKTACLFEDPSAAVQWQAATTFLAVGEGAVDAVPILRQQLRQRTPDTLVSRALAALATVGAAAHSELDLVLEVSRTTTLRSDALEALLQIAPDQPAVRSLLIDALYSSDSTLVTKARQWLDRAEGDVVDCVLSDAEARLSAADGVVRSGVAGILAAVALEQPDRVAQLVEPLFEPQGERCIADALRAASKLPRPLPTSLLAQVIRVAGGDDTAANQAMELLAELGPSAAAAGPALTAQLHAHADAPPLGGRAGRPSRLFASAALALAAVCPEAADEVPPLLAWLSRFSSRAWTLRDTPSWYTIGDVALAAARLGPASPAVADQIVSVAERSRKWAPWDAPGVRDFERKLRRIAEGAQAQSDLRSRLQALGIALVDEDERVGDGGGSEQELPDFPPEEEPPQPRHLLPAPKQFLRELSSALREGERFVGINAGSGPAVIAAAVDKAIRHVHRERRILSLIQIDALAALWGVAVARETGWTWAHMIQGEDSWICLVSGDRAHACMPRLFMEKQADRRYDTAALLLFNMIRAGNLPASSAGQLAFVG